MTCLAVKKLIINYTNDDHKITLDDFIEILDDLDINYTTDNVDTIEIPEPIKLTKEDLDDTSTEMDDKEKESFISFYNSAFDTEFYEVYDTIRFEFIY